MPIPEPSCDFVFTLPQLMYADAQTLLDIKNDVKMNALRDREAKKAEKAEKRKKSRSIVLAALENCKKED